jgi:hypothetical protein
MRILVATVLVLAIGVLFIQHHLLVALLLSGLFTMWFGGLALLVLALLIDAYFGAFLTFPYLSVVALVWYVASELVRLRVRIMK